MANETTKIKNISAREILDSRGEPTLEVEIISENGLRAKAQVPSGASKGKYEVLELRDNDLNRYKGKGVLKARENVKTKINNALKGMEITDQKKIDQIMLDLDATKNKSNLGANAILGVSLACARLGAMSKKIPLYEYLRKLYGIENKNFALPQPMFNIINAGKHVESSKAEIQEFMVVPAKNNFEKMLRTGVEIFYILKNILKGIKGYTTAVGDEGGFAPALKNNEEAIKLIEEAINSVGYKAGKDAFIALDAAASEFYDEKTKKYKLEGKEWSFLEIINLYQDWALKHPIISIEDGLAEDDWMGWKALTEKMKIQNKDLLIVGDDLFVTDTEKLKKGVEMSIANAILIKPNQIGTLTETLDCIKLARENDYKIIISHRSGETIDDFIADLAVAVNADFIKTGAPSRGERIAKYNRLLEIEEELQKNV
ncbi:MAG: enolase [Parcubacteria group bacterium Athens1014_10]|nr:MAG: enolase [Parcubacteria group bacterium Athens1014_10]TSD05131.1 MAG: enolase [Parcubacteria group bacterium Athens0714_12]